MTITQTGDGFTITKSVTIKIDHEEATEIGLLHDDGYCAICKAEGINEGHKICNECFEAEKNHREMNGGM